MIVSDSRQLTSCCKLVISVLLVAVTAESLTATVGSDVTLICNYDAKYYGQLPVCWGRGPIPNSGCADEVIRSDGTSVVSRLSERYLLTGELREGDVSLMIRQLEEADSGIYGCRVDIPGWFNDHKHEVMLSVVPAPPQPLTLDGREVRERTITVVWTPGWDGGRPITSYKIDYKNKTASWDTSVTSEIPNPSLTQVTLIDMRPAKAYNIRMFASNSVGVSEASNVLTLTTKEAAPEGPPLDEHLQALSSRSIKVTWKPPLLLLRNGDLQSYGISYREFDRTEQQFKRWHHQRVLATAEEESFVLNNLRPSTLYGVLIQAKTNAGIGPASTELFCSTLAEVHPTSTHEPTATSTIWEETTDFTPVPPDPPELELVEVKDKTVSLRWTAGFDGGSTISSYELESKSLNASWDVTRKMGDFSSNQTEATVIEMHPSTYNIRMFARNSMGRSEASKVLTVIIKERGQDWEHLSTVSAVTHAPVSPDYNHDHHVAAIVVPLLLVVLVVALAVTWKFHRMKSSKGCFGIYSLTNVSLRFRNSEALRDL